MEMTKQAIKGEALAALRDVASGSGDPGPKIEAAREMWHLAQGMEPDEKITVADEPTGYDSATSGSATVSSGGSSSSGTV